MGENQNFESNEMLGDNTSQPGGIQAKKTVNKKRLVIIIAIAVVVIAGIITTVVLLTHKKEEAEPLPKVTFVFTDYEKKLDTLDQKLAAKDKKVPQKKIKQALQKDYDYIKADNSKTALFTDISIQGKNSEVVCVLEDKRVYHHCINKASYVEDASGEVIQAEKEEEEQPAKEETTQKEELPAFAKKLCSESWIILNHHAGDIFQNFEFHEDKTVLYILSGNEDEERQTKEYTIHDDSIEFAADDVTFVFYNTNSDNVVRCDCQSSNGTYRTICIREALIDQRSDALLQQLDGTKWNSDYLSELGFNSDIWFNIGDNDNYFAAYSVKGSYEGTEVYCWMKNDHFTVFNITGESAGEVTVILESTGDSAVLNAYIFTGDENGTQDYHFEQWSKLD